MRLFSPHKLYSKTLLLIPRAPCSSNYSPVFFFHSYSHHTGFVGCGNKGVVRKKEGGNMDRGFRSTHFARAVVGSLIIKKI